MKAGLVVLNWNNARDTLACIASISRLEGEFMLVVVDNGSTDGSADVIESAMRATWRQGRVMAIGDSRQNEDGADVIAMLRTGRNGGYAFGNNRGIEVLLDAGADLVWILNNDTEVAMDALDQVIKWIGLHPGPLIAGTLVLDWSKPDTIECVGGATYHWATSRSRWIGRGVPRAAARAQPVDYVSGASMVITKSAIERIGLLEESLFLYFEEIDYAERARQAGVPLTVCQQAVVWHKGGQSTGGRQPWKSRSRSAIRHSFRSAVMTTRKHKRFLVPLVVMARLGFAGYLALFAGLEQAMAAVAGIREGLSAEIIRETK